MPSDRSVLFVSAFRTPFIEDDLAFLEKHFQVRTVIGHGSMAMLRIILRLLYTDYLVCWFASVYAFVGVFTAKFLSVKSIVMIGGVDVAKDEALQYGVWLSPWRARLARYVLRNATAILAVDPSLKEKAKALASYDGVNIHYVPTGYDPEYWKPLNEKKRLILSVARVRDRRTALVKGLDTLVEAAWKMPDTRFIVVGVDREIGRFLRPPVNMEMLEPVDRNALLPLYRQAKVYCQPSRHEGLSNALCEAMLCGCIPVATDVGGNPTAVGTEGFLVPASSVDVLLPALRKALSSSETLGEKARARVVSLFPKKKREGDLLRLLESFGKSPDGGA